MTFLKLLVKIRHDIDKIFAHQEYENVNFSVDASKPGFGDITCNAAFLLAKQLKQNPYEIAKTIASLYVVTPNSEIKSVTAHQTGNINFEINYEFFNSHIISASLQENYGMLDIGKKQKIIVEHTSVNPNKALHIGHIRNVVLGDTIARILKKVNFDVKVLNYVDDSGLQVADIIVGFKFAGISDVPPNGKKFDHYCGDDVYVKTTSKYESDKFLEEKRHQVLQEIEDENSEISKYAKNITRMVLAEQLKTVWELDVFYDCINFESQIIHSKLWEIIFDKLKSDNLIRLESSGDNEGCWVIPTNGDDDKILVRSNGVATYIAKDIPYAAWKLGLINDPFNYKIYSTQSNNQTLYETTLDKHPQSDSDEISFFGDKVITVIDNRQIRLQNIVTDLMSKFKSAGSYVHLGYESVTLSSDTVKTFGLDVDTKSTQMSGRKGLYINADSVIENLKKKIFHESQKRNDDLDEIQLKQIAKDVSIGTIRYEMIKPDLDKIITFDINNSLKLEGDTCSYIQYSYARASRILEKSDMEPNFDANFANLRDPHEIELLKKISMFDIFVNDAANNLSPKIIAKYCYLLASTFSSFYEHVQVNSAETSELKNSRVCLIHAYRNTMKIAFDLLGITTPERM
ncbi:MAG: arginine--tRNA ligase [Candidatus Nitrosopelagicus sp.]|jgi:arginyl-tRNA synthetase|nr:arginine--tRNA ligase [Candidatus Nitrosopelagicus sp.]